MIAVSVDFGVKDVVKRTLDTEFLFELFARSEKVINVAGRVSVGAFDVGGKNYG